MGVPKGCVAPIRDARLYRVEENSVDLTDEAIATFAQHLVPEAFTTASTAARVEIRPQARVAGVFDG